MEIMAIDPKRLPRELPPAGVRLSSLISTLAGPINL